MVSRACAGASDAAGDQLTLRGNVLFNTACARCDCCECCARGRADGDGDGCSTACVLFSACEASRGGGNISCGLGLAGDGSLAIGAGRVVLEEFRAAFGRFDVDSYGVLVVR